MNKTIDGFLIKTKRTYPIQELLELMQGNLKEKYGEMSIGEDNSYGIGGQAIYIHGVDKFEILVQSKQKIIFITQVKQLKESGFARKAAGVAGGAIDFFDVVAGGSVIGSIKNSISSVGERIDIGKKILKLDGSKRNWAVMEELAKEIEKLVEVKTGGCYVATCIYGSYDCPEVWTLRRYRDTRLLASWYGRLFIQIYYTISPHVVKLFGNKKWFNKFFKPVLNRFVRNLHESGINSSPYSDKSTIRPLANITRYKRYYF
jgi:hypothetical protein